MRKRTGIISTISTEKLEQIVLSSLSLKDVLRKLGYGPNSGSMFYRLKERLEKENISTIHFSKCLSIKAQKYKLCDILVKDSKYTNIWRLKKRLISEKILEEVCSICGLKPWWNGKELKLQLDHINGISNDHRLENIRLVCPNCHSQTETFCGKNNSRYLAD